MQFYCALSLTFGFLAFSGSAKEGIFLRSYAPDFSSGIATLPAKPGFLFINTTTSTQAFHHEPYYWAGDFSDGLAAVIINGKVGYIDKKGRQVISPKYDPFIRIGKKENRFISGWFSGSHLYEEHGILKMYPRLYLCAPYRNGRCRVKSGDEYYYIDAFGSPVGDEKFSSCTDFHNGFAFGKKGDSWHKISIDGSTVILKGVVEMYQHSVGEIWGKMNSGEQFFIQKDGKMNQISTLAGTMALPLDKERFEILDYGRYKSQIIDKNTGLSLTDWFDNVYPSNDGFYVVKNGIRRGVVDTNPVGK